MNNFLLTNITLINFYETLFIAIGNALLMFFASFKFIQTLQQSGYDGKGYFTWLLRKDNIYQLRLVIVSILGVLAFMIFNIAAMIFIESVWVIYIGFAFYIFFFIIYIKKDRTVKSKVPLVKTNRVKRLLVTFVLLSFFISLLGLTIVNAVAVFGDSDTLLYKLRYGVICFSPMLLPFIVLLAYYVNEPFERYNKRQYVERCKQTLIEREDLIVIGITGSYGKTSVKEILKTVLSEKYNVLATPHSYNTPMGICKSVKLLKDTHEIFIAEMGARNVGDIKELAEIINPQYAVMTGITGQHIETFGSITNIKKTKNELIENMRKDGFAFFSTDSDNTRELMQACPIDCMGAGVDLSYSPEVYAGDITVSGAGTRFDLYVGGQKIECSTILIGTHNVSNICLAAAVAHKLGLTIEEIAAGINRIAPIKHRLEIMENKYGCTVIDDSFNANVNGTIAAMEVLDCFDGRKIVITPGLVELGKSEEHENYMLGKRLGEHADIVILVGKRRIEKINEGLISVDFPKENIYCVKDLDEGNAKLKEIVERGDVIIFENDLPDKYN